MKTGLAPLVVCVALLISSASAGGETKTGVGESKTSTGLDSGDSYLGSVDPNQKNSYDFKYVNKESDTSERDGTLGDSVVAGKETDATAPSAPVTLDPELKKESGIANGAISTDASKATGTGGIDSGPPPATPAPMTKTEGDPKASKGQWTPAPTQASDNKENQSTDAPQSPPASNPTTDTNASKETESTQSTPAPPQLSQGDQSTDDDQSSDEDESGGDDQSDDASESSDTPQSTPAATTTDSNNQWTPAPNEQNNQQNQQPTQAPNNEAPQPTQPPQAANNEAPQPTQPSQGGQNNGQWTGNSQAPATNDNHNSTWEGSWGSATQTQNQPTRAPTTASGSSQESNRDSPAPAEPTTYEGTPATAPSPPVSNCKVRRRSRH